MASSDPNFWKHLDDLTLADLNSLKALGRREKQVLDYKAFDLRPGGQPINAKAIGPDVSAFANAGGGRIVLGALDDAADGVKDFQGAPAAALQSIRSTLRSIAHTVQPPPVLESKEIALDDGSLVVVVDVRPGFPPHQYKGTYYLRSVDGTTPMPHTMVVQAITASSSGDQMKAWGNRRARSSDEGFLGSNTPLGDTHRNWFLGVELKPAYPTPRPLMDATDKRVATLVRHLMSAGFGLKGPRRFKLDAYRDEGEMKPAQHLLLTFEGQVCIADEIANSLKVEQEELVHWTEQWLKLLAELAEIMAPSMEFGVRVVLWGVGTEHPFQLYWRNPDDAFRMAMLHARAQHHAVLRVEPDAFGRSWFPSDLSATRVKEIAVHAVELVKAEMEVF